MDREQHLKKRKRGREKMKHRVETEDLYYVLAKALTEERKSDVRRGEGASSLFYGAIEEERFPSPHIVIREGEERKLF